jgi:hypothetical protein
VERRFRHKGWKVADTRRGSPFDAVATKGKKMTSGCGVPQAPLRDSTALIMPESFVYRSSFGMRDARSAIEIRLV